MLLANLEISSFRNISEHTFSFSPEGALFIGANGAGKTNLLEAIHVLCTGRSQRGAAKRRMIRDGETAAHISGDYISKGSIHPKKAGMGFSRDGKVILDFDGEKVTSFSDWFRAGSVVTFGPEDIELVLGSPSERRAFMDILLSQTDSQYLDNIIRYRRILLQKNRLLTERVSGREMDAYDIQLAGYGAYLHASRFSLFENLDIVLPELYRGISGGKEIAGVKYQSSISCTSGSEIVGQEACNDVFYNALIDRREYDQKRGFCSVGPHRDDFDCRLDKRSAKSYGSRGQCRSLGLSLRLSALGHIEKTRGESPIILVDDAFADLDEFRTAKMEEQIAGRGQLFVTALTRSSRFAATMPCYQLAGGTITAT